MTRTHLTSLRAAIRRFPDHQAGNVAMLFGLLLLPMLGAIGLAVDFGSILTARNKGQVAADAAALQASGVARDLIKAGDGSDASTAAAIAEAKLRAEKLFKVHAEQSGLTNYTPTVSIIRTGQKISTTVSFTVDTTTYIAKLFKQSAYSATGSAASSSTLPSYSDVYLALDISGSMGIAASQAEMTKLYNAKGKRTDNKTQATGCVFGCHVIESGWKESFSTVAKNNNVQLRIDVLRDAVQTLITTAENDADSAPIYRIGLYTMGASSDASTWSLNKLYGLSNNFSALHTAAGTIDIATPPASAPQKQNTYINEQLNSLLPTIPASKDGSSQDMSKKYLFIVTDGARDVPSSFGSCTTPVKKNSGPWKDLSSGRCTNAINPSYCKSFKDKGVIVGVLQTTYVPIPNDANKPYDATSNVNQWFGFELRDNLVPSSSTTKIYDRISPALQECASPGWFFEASDGDAIEVAMKKMFDQTTFAPSLTN